MADIRPFRALRPAVEYAKDIAALPYDVYSREEAAIAVQGKPLSFLNIDRPETAFPAGCDMYADEVYEHAAAELKSMTEKGYYIREESPCYYVYELTMDGRSQTGIAALSSVDDYLSGVCKKHENTVAEKEKDRIHHVDTLSAQTGPIFLSYHASDAIETIIAEAKKQPALYDFVSEDGIGHRVWVISGAESVEKLTAAFAAVPNTYIADGHHRAASAVKVALKRREADPGYKGDEEFNYFLSVLFPDRELKIFDYNRVVKDLNGRTVSEFLKELGEIYEISEVSGEDAEIIRPAEKYTTGMYLDGHYYMLKVKDSIAEAVKSDPVKCLDVSILQDCVLSPILGIKDPRTDKRIKFVGGIRGLNEIKKNADEFSSDGSPAVAFAMYPTSMSELFGVADAGLLMPPKSTWFEPKLRSGIFIHEF